MGGSSPIPTLNSTKKLTAFNKVLIWTCWGWNVVVSKSVTFVIGWDFFYLEQKTGTVCPKSFVSGITNALLLWRDARYCKAESDSGRPCSSLDPGESSFVISDAKDPVRREQNWGSQSEMHGKFKWDSLINSSKVSSFLFPWFIAIHLRMIKTQPERSHVPFHRLFFFLIHTSYIMQAHAISSSQEDISTGFKVAVMFPSLLSKWKWGRGIKNKCE